MGLAPRERLAAVMASMALGLDPVADYTTDCRPAYRADCAAAGQDRANDRARTGANRRILVLRGHPAAGCQTKHRGHGCRTYRQCFHHVHL